MDDDDGVEMWYVLIVMEIVEDGMWTRVSLSLDRVDARIAAAAARLGRDEMKVNEDVVVWLRDVLRVMMWECDEMWCVLE